MVTATEEGQMDITRVVQHILSVIHYVNWYRRILTVIVIQDCDIGILVPKNHIWIGCFYAYREGLRALHCLVVQDCDLCTGLIPLRQYN